MSDKRLDLLKEAWGQLDEMPAWHDENKNLSRHMGKRHQKDVDAAYKGKKGKKLDDFWLDDKYNVRVYKVESEFPVAGETGGHLDYHVMYDNHEVAAFHWMKTPTFWTTMTAMVAPEHQGNGLAFKAYTFMIDKYMHALASDETLTGETGKGSFDLWVKLGKTYPYKYLYKSSNPPRLKQVKEFTRDMMGDDKWQWAFVVSQTKVTPQEIRNVR